MDPAFGSLLDDFRPSRMVVLRKGRTSDGNEHFGKLD